MTTTAPCPRPRAPTTPLPQENLDMLELITKPTIIYALALCSLIATWRSSG
jgi:hypothetical protein